MEKQLSKGMELFLFIANILFGLLIIIIAFLKYINVDHRAILGIFGLMPFCIGTLGLLNALKMHRTLKLLKYLLVIPVVPMLLVGFLSQTKQIATITLPVMTLPCIIVLSTCICYPLTLLHLGERFDTFAIPYINLTLIIIGFAYYDLLLVKTFAKYIPDSQMPQIVKQWSFDLMKRKIFLKLAYLAVTILIICTTLERLSGLSIIPFVPIAYKSICLEALLTFVVIDRFISKMK